MTNSQHCSQCYTFDEKFVKRAKAISQCDVHNAFNEFLE